MVTAAAGLATTGLEVYAATFASFLALLCCEQIRTDVAYTNQRVRLIGHHSGITLRLLRDLAPRDGRPGHHADRSRLTVVAPADAASLAALIREATDNRRPPSYFRIGRWLGNQPSTTLA